MASGLFGVNYNEEIGLGELIAGDTVLLSLVVAFVVAALIWVICFIIVVIQCRVGRRKRTLEISSDEDAIEKELISISSNEKISSRNEVENQTCSKQTIQDNTNTIEEDPMIEAMYDMVITNPKKQAANYENTNPNKSSTPPAPPPPPPPVSTTSTMVYAVVNKKKKVKPETVNYDEVPLDTYDKLNRDYPNVNPSEAADGDGLAMSSFYDVIGNGDTQNFDIIASKRDPQIPVFQVDPTDNYDVVNM